MDLVTDFSSLTADAAAALLRRWRAADPTGEAFVHATCALPPGLTPAVEDVPRGWRTVGPSPVAGFWNEVLALAGRDGRPALVAIGGVEPCLDAAAVLAGLLEEDDMFGAALARVQCEDGCCIETLAGPSAPAPAWVPQPVLGDLPPFSLAGGVTGPCVVCAPLVLADFADADPGLRSLIGTVAYRLGAARRCGLRAVVSNRAVIRMSGARCAAPPPRLPTAADEERLALAAFDGDSARAWEEFRGAAAARFERMAGQRLEVSGGRPPTLLLDLRNLRDAYNGTAFAALGAASGLYRADAGWDVTILAHPSGADFHRFDRRFPGWSVRTAMGEDVYDAALRLSQPWHVQEIVDLHNAARVNAYLVLDTIAWDVVHVAPPQLDGVWRFLAQAADGLLFISDFSRRRFHTRFGSGPLAEVCHLSFDPEDYIHPDLDRVPPGDAVVVVGNQLEHKDVAATVGLIASAFPTLRIEALGPSPVRSRRITAHASGQLEDADVHRLFAAARIVVFPSFYEGFGFPIVTALAYGRTLLARNSPLLDEIADHCVARGRLIGYDRRDQIVDVLGALLHGEAVAEQAIGALRTDRPRGWLEVGRQLDRHLRRLLGERAVGGWLQRETLVAQVRAAQADG